MKNHETGKRGERVTEYWLTKKGYTIVARNFRIPGGEIDLIAENQEYLVFVEVKTRKPGSISDGFDAIHKQKQKCIIKTALRWMELHETDLQPRFDVAIVVLEDRKLYDFQYIDNAFDATGVGFIF